MKGQISVEHIVLLAIVMIILLPGIYTFYNRTTQLKEEFDDIRIKSVGEDLLDAVTEVTILGDGSKKTLLLDLPENFRNISIIGNNTMVISYENDFGVSQAVFVSKNPLTKSNLGFPLEEIKPGKNKISLQNYGGIICLSEQRGDCSFYSCGNRILEPSLNETCDVSDFGNLSCESLGYAGGNLVCKSDCSGVETDYCFGCQDTGILCLDDVMITGQSSCYLNSGYVSNYLGNCNSGTPQTPNEVSYEDTPPYPSTCGGDGMFKMRYGGGLQVDLSSQGLSEGIYTVTTTAYRNSSQTNSFIGLQCDGSIFSFKQTSEIESIYFNCIIKNNNPDFRILSHGTTTSYVEKLRLKRKCETGTCHKSYDTGFLCLSQNHYVEGEKYKSDFTDFKYGFNKDGDVIDWTTIIDTNTWNFPNYEPACSKLYYKSPANPPVGEKHHGKFKIKDDKLLNILDPSDPSGDYTLMINMIYGNESLPADYKLRCGNGWVQIPDAPESQGYHYMMTYNFDCSFDGDGNDKIEIEANSIDVKSLYIERFRLRKKCN